jgi:hypothetical protein
VTGVSIGNGGAPLVTHITQIGEPMQHPPPRLRAIAFAAAASLAALVAPAHADELSDVKAQVDLLLKRVAELEKKPAAAAPMAANVVTGGATKGSFKLPGSDTSVTIGGYVKLDAVFSDKSAGVGSTGNMELEPGTIAVGPNAGANERNQVKLHARQSRLFVKTSTPTGYGELGTYLEYDLFGANGNESVSNSNGLRVRHAYGTLGGLLAGQTWTTFSDPATYAETLDFGGAVGVIFARQAQVRWTQKFTGGQWSVALENPESVVSLPDGSAFRADDDRVPDLAANIHFDTARGNYSIAALVRQVRVDSAGAPNSRSDKLGYGLGVNGVIPLGGKDDARLSAYYGNALGRYTVGYFTDGILDTAGRVQLANQWTASAAYRHFWSENVRSNFVLSALKSSNPSGSNGGLNRGAESAHVNVIWSPVPQTNLGLEYIYARREIENGLSGRLNRLQASAQYLF